MYLKISLFFGLLLSFVSFGCEGDLGSCQKHYNCPAGTYCVNGLCKRELAEGMKRPTEYPFVRFVDGGEVGEQVIDEFHCGKDGDCGKFAPHCFESRCVAGYLTFDFSKGHFIVDNKALSVRCKDDNACHSWQQCHLNYCRNRLGLKSFVRGIATKKGIFLGDYSYSDIIEEKGKKRLRIVMVGSFSEKRKKHLIIEIAMTHLRFGWLSIDGDNVRAQLFDVANDLVPPKINLMSVAISGKIKITQMSHKLGERVAGIAKLVMMP